MKTTDEILTMAETTLAKLAIAAHESNYTKLVVHVDEDTGDIDDAFVTEDVNQYDSRNNGWTMIYCTGTGSCPCNCDACADGDDPAEWAGDDGLEYVDEAIQRGIDELA